VKTKNANTLANLALLPDRGRGTFGSAGAGRGMLLRGATNIRLRRSREGNGAAGRYKHSAPLEPEGEWCCGRYKHSAPLEPQRRYSDVTTGSRAGFRGGHGDPPVQGLFTFTG